MSHSFPDVAWLLIITLRQIYTENQDQKGEKRDLKCITYTENIQQKSRKRKMNKITINEPSTFH